MSVCICIFWSEMGDAGDWFVKCFISGVVVLNLSGFV